FVNGELNVRSRAGAGGDAQGSLLIAVFLVVSAERQDDPVVERSSQGRTFLFSDADHFAGNVVPANLFANGIQAGHEVFHDVHANYADRSGAIQIRIGDVAARDEIDIVQFRHLRSPGAQVGILQRIQAALHFYAAAQRGADFLARLAEIAHRFEIVVSEALALLEFEPVVNVGDDGRLLGKPKDVGAQAEDARGHVLVCAVDQTDDGDHRSHTNDHADQRQDAAQLVGPKAGGGDR